MIRLDLHQSYFKKYISGHVNPFWSIDQYTSESLGDFVVKFPEYFVNIENITYTVYKSKAIDIVQHHTEQPNLVIILVMLEDWKPGHYLEIDGEGIVNWNAGDYFAFNSYVPYATSNIGRVEDIKYILKMTATLKPLTSHYHQNNKLYEYNIHDRPWIIDNHLIQRLKDSINNNNGYPYMIYLGNETIHQLENLKYDYSTVRDINEKGLDIYLYEPLCIYHKNQTVYQEGGTKHTEWFYSEFKHDINYKDLRADELDSIIKFAENNDIKDIRVHTNEYNVEKYLPYYKNKVKLLTDDICLKAGWFKKILDPDFLEHKLTKKFFSLNYRYTFHRNLIAAFLTNFDTKLSWNFKCDYENMSHGPWFKLTNPVWNKHRDYIKKGVDYINEKSPFVLDFNFTESSNIDHNYFKNPFPQHRVISKIDLYAIEEHYKDIFCEVICETRYAQPAATYSEKIHQSISYFKPFILVGAPHTLEYLRKNGFKTFNEFWDESYDSIEDHEKRMVKIFDLIQEIDKMNMHDCNELYKRMLPILKHNQKLLKLKLRP